MGVLNGLSQIFSNPKTVLFGYWTQQADIVSDLEFHLQLEEEKGRNESSFQAQNWKCRIWCFCKAGLPGLGYPAWYYWIGVRKPEFLPQPL